MPDTLAAAPAFLYRDFATQEAIDAQYDTSRQVVDPMALLAGRRAWSDEARAALPFHADLAYGPSALERLDVFPAPAKAAGGAPLVVFIHGGYWSSPWLVKELYAWVARGMHAHGFATAVLDYGVCPDHTLDALVAQSRRALGWLHGHAADFGADPDKLYVTGHSAGGHLSAMLALTDWSADGLPADLVKGICPISGLFDLGPFPHSWLQPKLQLTDAQVRRNGPIHHLRDGAPSMLITWGAGETPEFYRQAEAFHDAARALGVDSRLMPLDGCLHNSAIDGLRDPQSALCLALAAHVRQCTGTSTD